MCAFKTANPQIFLTIRIDKDPILANGRCHYATLFAIRSEAVLAKLVRLGFNQQMDSSSVSLPNDKVEPFVASLQREKRKIPFNFVRIDPVAIAEGLDTQKIVVLRFER
jgi:hypothetical protein